MELKRRLESFVDLVFGLSLSVSAARLVLPSSRAEIGPDLLGLVGFVVTFAAIAGMWLVTHRVYTAALVMHPSTIAAVFVELCGIALLPDALVLVSKTRALGLSVLVAYDLVYLLIVGSLGYISAFGFFKLAGTWDDERRARDWRNCTRLAIVSAFFVVHTGIALALPAIAQYFYFLLFLARPISYVVPAPARRSVTP